MNGKEISLYIHIPFCNYKCPYCHFYVVLDKEELKDLLLKALLQELASWKGSLQKRELVSIYFGGGTPILFQAKRLSRVLEEIQKILPINCEITIEANPENIELQHLKELHEIGVNRLSIGIQSFEAGELSILGRRHDSSTCEKAIITAEKAGFENISIDLMYEVPKQTERSFRSSLERVKLLPITHLSLYNLTIEPYTPFEKKEKALRALMPDEAIALNMYKEAISYLQSLGLKQYEISAFAKEGLQSRHNVGYWTGREFLGLGPSAFSYFNNVRFRNIANLARYAKILDANESPVDFRDDISLSARRKELLALHLRLIEGVNLEEFEKLNGPLEGETRQALSKLEGLGLLTFDGTRFGLTEKGIYFYDTVASELI